ncbi:MAG TPA: ABC transporter permease [Solirubrobacterales bacterium]|nr:ABC transporter permease [Solirubrobacterales bacterium]
MHFIWEGLQQAVHMILHDNGELRHILWVTLHVGVVATVVAAVVGIPLGLLFGLGSFRGRRIGVALLNAGLGLPPVVVGLIVALLLFRGAPLGGLEWIYTVEGMILAQAILALPLVAAFTATAVGAVAPALLDQARALGASRRQVYGLALREARVGVLGALIAAFGSAVSEVGAVVLVGGNIHGQTQTLASAVLTEVAAGEYGTAIAIGIILLGLIVVCGGMLTAIQQHGTGDDEGAPWFRWRAS